MGNKTATAKGTLPSKTRPTSDAWIHDIGMDQIVEREGTLPWTAEEYLFHYERKITGISGDEIEIDAPIMTALEAKYGGGFVYLSTYSGRINHVGVENLQRKSTYVAGQETSDEAHAWTPCARSRRMPSASEHGEHPARALLVLRLETYDRKQRQTLDFRLLTVVVAVRQIERVVSVVDVLHV
jgi:hypothetical protein